MAGLTLSATTSPQWRNTAGKFAKADAGGELATAAQAWGRGAITHLREATPSKTGATRAAWRADWKPSTREVVVTNKKPTALWLLEGTRAHVIAPRGHPFLRFALGGDTVYARLVHHPGTKPNQQLVDAVDHLATEAQTELDAAGQRLLHSLEG